MKTNEIMLLTAMQFHGIKEIKGDANNPQIVRFFSYLGFSWVRSDETAWCSAFINYCAKINKIQYSGKLNARSWLEIGKETKNPEIGDLVIFWRESPDSWKGHIGLYCGESDEGIYCLGGNQNNMVNIKEYDKSRLLGYRKLNYL